MEQTCKKLGEKGLRYMSLGKNAEEYAHNIFETMRKAEKIYGYILAEAMEGGGMEASVMNRMYKSSGGHIV